MQDRSTDNRITSISCVLRLTISQIPIHPAMPYAAKPVFLVRESKLLNQPEGIRSGQVGGVSSNHTMTDKVLHQTEPPATA